MQKSILQHAAVTVTDREVSLWNQTAEYRGKTSPMTSNPLELLCAQEYVRENESVAVQPLRILGVESHELVEQDVGNRGHAHRGTRVTGVGLRSGIDLYKNVVSN